MRNIKNIRGAVRRTLAAAAFISMSAMAVAPAYAEDTIQMEEYPAPANSVAKQAEQMKAEQAAAEAQQAAAPSQAAAKTASPEKKKETKHYPGMFDVFSPLSKYLPLKSGTVRGSFINFGQTPGGAAHLDSRNFTGGYFLESDEMNYGVLKNTSAKVQFNRQLRNSLNSNFMNEWNTRALKTAVKFSRNVVRTGSAGSQNVQDTRRLSFDHQTKNKIGISYITDMVGSRVISTSPSKTMNKKQTWTVTAPVRKAKLTASRSLTANRNNITGSVAKALLSDIRLDVPVSKRFELNLGYQFAGNDNYGAGVSGQTTRKSTNIVGLSYLLAEDTKLSVLLNNITTRNFSSTFSSNHTRKVDVKFDHSFSERAKFKSSFASNNDGISGRTKVKTNSFSYDHKNIKYFSGTTTMESRRQVQSGLNSTAGDTLTVTTPLNYFNNRLNVNLQHTGNSQKSLTSHQDVTSKNNTVSADVKVTKSLTVGTSLNNVRNATYQLDAITAITSARTHTYKSELLVKNFLGGLVPSLENTKYIYSVSNAATSNIVPTSIGSVNRVRKYGALFQFKEDEWKGRYTFERAISSTSAGQTSRALIHKVEWSFDNVFGCEFTTNYTGAFQKTGVQSSGLFKLTKKLQEKESIYATFEFLRNKDRVNATSNSRNRYFELGFEASF